MRLTTMVLVAAAWGVVPAEAQQKIPIRQLGPAEAVATTKVDAQSLVRPLSDGRVIVAYRRTVGILSADLKTYTSIIDSTSNVKTSSGLTQLALIQARGDTTYVPDDGAKGLIVVGPGGTAGSMVALPKASDMGTVGFTTTGTFRTHVDPKGRLWYRSATSFDGQMAGQMHAGDTLAKLSPPADSFPLLRADFDTRAVDTVAAIHIPGPNKSMRDTVDGVPRNRQVRYPFSIVDAWTVLNDGTIAIVRGQDYHVDWIHPDGSRSSTPKMSFDWRRITDEEKAKLADSLQKLAVASNARDSANRAARPETSGRLAELRVTEVAPVSTMPDYFPPLREGAARGDLDGNLWILPTTSASAQGGLLYDVVNRKGEVFERVQMPPGCALGGFGKERVVYLTCPGTSVERRRILN